MSDKPLTRFDIMRRLPCLVEDEKGDVILLFSFTDRGVTNSIADYFEGVYVCEGRHSSPKVRIIAEHMGPGSLSAIKLYNEPVTLQNK